MLSSKTTHSGLQKEIASPMVAEQTSSVQTINGFERWWVAQRVKLTILAIALKTYKSFSRAMKVVRAFKEFRQKTYGSNKRRKCVKIDGKYYFALYVPGFPSKQFKNFILTEFNRISSHKQTCNRFQTIHFAMTTKCPLHCEHCFEWNNLNKAETFTQTELKSLVNAFQKAGCTQFHFTGGEPMVRIKTLENLITFASANSECWVLSSGYNLTSENAELIKRAGATGVIISLDHFDPAIHNAFRGSGESFKWAMAAVSNANRAKIITAFSICLTQPFISEKNLLLYLELAKNCGVSFIQLLEPKAVGHYEKKNVALTKEQLDLLDSFYMNINFNKQYDAYPIIIYHGFYQRRMGCLAAGRWSLYLDCAGFIDACPFCHTKNYNARDMISGYLDTDRMEIHGCPVYN